MNLVKMCLEMLAETANENDDYKKLSELFGKCVKPCDQEIPQERIVDIDVPVPQAIEEIGEAFELIPQECGKQCNVKQTDDQNEQQLQDNQQQLRQAARKEREGKKGMKGRKEENKNGRKVVQKGDSKKVEKEEWETFEEERKKEREKCFGKEKVRLTRKEDNRRKEMGLRT